MEYLSLPRGDNEGHPLPLVLTYCALYIVLNGEQRRLLKDGSVELILLTRGNITTHNSVERKHAPLAGQDEYPLLHGRA